MNPSALDLLAHHLAAHLDCAQDVVCQQILHMLVETGQPLVPPEVANRLHIPLESLTAHLTHIPDVEVDMWGRIVGWGMTLVPTHHQFWVQGRALFTWCAFDTVLFPSLLHCNAHVQSRCQTTGQPITFLATPEGITNLSPTTSVLSLIVPSTRCECTRGTFCGRSSFFQTQEAASPWISLHPDAVFLSVEQAAVLGRLTARVRSSSSG